MVGVPLLLIGHGETTWNQELRWRGQADIPLDEVGIEPARSQALKLRKEGNPIAAVYSSPLSRAFHTAESIADTLNGCFFSAPLWCEMDIGVWSGLTTEEVIARHSEDWKRIRAGEDLPRGGGKTMAQFHQRVLQGTELLTEKHGGASSGGNPRRTNSCLASPLSGNARKPLS